MSTSESWGVTGIPRDALAPYPWSCGFGWLRAKEKEVSAQERTLLLYFTYTLHRFTKKAIDSVWRAVPLQVMRFLGYKDEIVKLLE